MIKCPFCHFENEDGALFCERCTSDLTAVAPSPSPAKAAAPPMHPPVPPIPMAEAVPMMAEAEPYVAEAEPYVAEAVPFTAEPYVAEAVPFEAMHAEPLPAHHPEPIPAIPLELQPASPASPPPLEHPRAAAMPAPIPVTGHGVPALELEPSSPPPPVAPQPPPPPEAAPTSPTGFLPPNAQPRLLVLRGQKRNVEYPIFEGPNFLGRADEKPVDIDLEEQEPPDRVWCSRQHACIHWEDNQLLVEDLNSANGTYVNRTRVYPGQKRALSVNDIVQIGNVQLKVVV